MNNQYSRGCGYNYRRSAQRNMPIERRPLKEPCMENQSPEKREESCCMNEWHMEKWPAGKPLAMGYVPMQVWSQPLPLCRGLQNGTIFSDLFKPFFGKGGACR